MKKMLITGGTVFVSRYAAQYFSDKYDVYVLNRNTRPQCEGVTLIEGDRHQLGELLRGHHFDAVLDITAYDEADIQDLLDGLGSFDDYILISSSAVYPEYAVQPFTEETPAAANRLWGKYGADKIAAEKALRKRVPNAYILRPPYLYGPGNNVYREAFVFDCAMQNRPFYLPGEGELKLQFFHVRDLCRFMEIILQKHPADHVFNVGNRDAVTVKAWVTACYHILQKEPEFINVSREIEQRSYFPFYDYAYHLDVEKQDAWMPEITTFASGLMESWNWYSENKDKVIRKPLLEFINQNLLP